MECKENKLSPGQNKTIKEFWIYHKENKRHLHYRKFKLLNPYHEADGNIGGGKANNRSNPTERKAIVLSEDERYQHLKKITDPIEGLYQDLDDDLKSNVHTSYWDKDGCYEWVDFADKLSMSRKKVLRKRNVLIDKTAERTGWI